MKQLLLIEVDGNGSLFFHSDFDFPDVLKRRPPLRWEKGLYRELSHAIPHCGTNLRRAVNFVAYAAADPRADYLGLHPELEEALSGWRRNKAREQGVPAYRILHQRVLLAIADEAPLTREELLEIPGFGPGLYRRCGEELLALVRGQNL